MHLTSVSDKKHLCLKSTMLITALLDTSFKCLTNPPFLWNVTPRYAFKSKPFLPAGFVKTSSFCRQSSSEPLQKSNSGENISVKAENNAPSREAALPGDQPGAARAGAKLSPQMAERQTSQVVTSLEEITPPGLIQRREASEYLLNADPFEEVPGPELLKKVSSVWRYVPEIGCQATVSVMLSFYNMTQRFMMVSKMGNLNSRPFDNLFRKYGPIVKLQGPLGADVVLIFKPEHMAKVYDQEGRHPVRATLDSVEKCRAKTRKSCGGPFNLSGVEWEEVRKALQEPLSKSGERYFKAIEEAADMFIVRIRHIKNRQNEVPEDFMTEVTKWALECFCHVTLGKSLGFLSPGNQNTSSESYRLLKAVMDAAHNICKCESGFQLWRFMNTTSLICLEQACEVIDSFISKHIRVAHVNLTRNKDEMLNRQKHGGGIPFIENLLLTECMSPEEVLTCLVDLLLIGVNTTSSSLGFTLYHLAQNQRTQRTLFKEVKTILPEKHSTLQYEHLSSLKYLEACINENHRLRMPMPTVTRVLPNDIALSNFRIPKGTYMVMDAQAACLREQNFEKSDKYLPERWFDQSNMHPFSFLPFGHGVRSCIGKQLAEIQLKNCLAKIIRNYQVEYNYEEIRGTKTVISFPGRPLKLSFIEREE